MQTVRVLVVTEDYPTGSVVNSGGFGEWKTQGNARARNPETAYSFHLGEFVRVLTATTWVGFQLELVRALRDAHDAIGGLSDSEFQADRHADVVGFRFDQTHVFNGQTRTLMDYDMILFFPQASSDPTPDVPTTISEAAAIAAFMEAGRGFFATGDHYNLGSQLAGVLPRVRNMRRWWTDPSSGFPLAPGGGGTDRHDTTVPGADSKVVFEDQSDQFPQTIKPTMYGAGLSVRQGYPAYLSVPHPLLCSPLGVVTKLPDHMHEGWCEVPADLSLSFAFADVSGREYPDYEGEPLAPEIVATGTIGVHTTPYLDPLDAGFHDGADPNYQATLGGTFGVICAWDGHRVAKGRVVVDSTWHHFFNINLTGDRLLENTSHVVGATAADEQKKHGFYVNGSPVPEYQLIQHYYRNIIYWLIPANRTKLIIWHSLFDLVQGSRLREELTFRDFTGFNAGSYPYFAELAETYFRQALGACTVYKLRKILYQPKIPWYEWIEEIVDPWDPALAQRGPSRETLREQALGAAGVAPTMDAFLKVGVGAAVITAATVLREHGRNKADLEILEKRFDQVFTHAMGLYGKQLEAGRAVYTRMERMFAKR